MDRLNMQSKNLTQENIEKIFRIFPNIITEIKDKNGNIKKVIDKELLLQELSDDIIDGNKERYQLTWPGKKEAILTANTPINKTLRPAKDESQNWENTENIYIEGDNLEALKLLQESYLGEIKCIYIDPPYNTGKDFIYKDNFAQDKKEYLEESGQIDEEGNRFFQNTEYNGRYHSDWLSMMYPRLKLARNLLREDGIIFVSIDDNEIDNLKKMMNEIFGEKNFMGIITWSKKRKGSFLSKRIISLTEYLLVYAKDITSGVYLYGGRADSNESQPIIKRTNNVSQLTIKAGCVSTKLKDGIYEKGRYGDDINPVELIDDVEFENGVNKNTFRIKAPFTWSQQFLDEQLKKGSKLVINTMNFQLRVFRAYDEDNFKGFPSYIDGVKIRGANEDAYEDLADMFDAKGMFDYSKPVNYIKELIKAATYFDKDSIILDFFSGSATTAHAVMELNAEDGGTRKYIMVQIPEPTGKDSEAYKSGYKTIAEIGRERIRRAAEKIKDETGKSIDYGFRLFKVDTSNMKDVYYRPDELEQTLLDRLESNIKEDRTALDLLIQVMLELGIKLSLPMETKNIKEKDVYLVAGNSLAACFDENLDESLIRELARYKPLKAVFRDNSFKSCTDRINLEEIFKGLSPNTELKIL